MQTDSLILKYSIFEDCLCFQISQFLSTQNKVVALVAAQSGSSDRHPGLGAGKCFCPAVYTEQRDLADVEAKFTSLSTVVKLPTK